MIGKTDLKLTRQDKIQRPEIRDVKDRVNKLETQEPANIANANLATMTEATIKGRASGAGTGTPTDLTAAQVATIINQSPFTYPLIAPWMDWPLNDVTNGSHFNDNTGSGTIPSGWTQTDAAQATKLNDPYGFWNLVGASGETSWAFKMQTGFTIESLASNAWKSFWVGPILLRESLASADINYYFGVYRNNAGAIDTNTFVRMNINWNSAGSTWQVRGERKDGTTQTNGTYYTLARIPVQPFGARIALQNNTNKNMVVYLMPNQFVPIHMNIGGATVGSGVTWGNVWWQFSMSRGAGNDDRILIGGIDYTADS